MKSDGLVLQVFLLTVQSYHILLPALVQQQIGRDKLLIMVILLFGGYVLQTQSVTLLGLLVLLVLN